MLDPKFLEHISALSHINVFVLSALIVLILPYVIGSIPFGYVIARMSGLGDIRNIGSGNTGATNVLRTGKKKLALYTLLLDGGKGAVAIWLLSGVPKFIEKSEVGFGGTTTQLFELALSIGLLAILGHCFPIWLKFKGGKGVATGLGVLLVAVPYAGLAACAAWIATAKITKYSSLSALIAFLIAPIVTLFIYGASPAAICALITLLIWVRHKDNIKRLLKGEESKIGQKNNPHPEEDASEPVSK